MAELLGLQWVTMPDIATASPESAAGSAERPDPQARARLIEALYDCARRGDIRAIESRLSEFERLASANDELASRLRMLTQRYDMKGIRALLQPPGDNAS
jgi:hypothetical protein